MQIRNVRVLHGPSVWAGVPVFELDLDFEDLDSYHDARSLLGCFVRELLDDLPKASGDLPQEFAQALIAGVRKLQQLAGSVIGFTAAQKTPNARSMLAAVEFAEESIARAAIEIAWRLLTNLAHDSARPTPDDIERLKSLPHRLPSTVAAIYQGAKNRGVPMARLSPEYNGYLYLGHGSRQRRVRWSEPDAVSGVARLASTDKYLTKQLLESIGVPVPVGRLAASVEEAWTAANEVGLPVAIKPYNCDLQTGVTLDVRTREQVEAALLTALEHSSWALVEHFAPGVEHRVLVVGERVVAVARIEPPQVLGDGTSTIQELVNRANLDPRRGDDSQPDAPLHKLKIDDVAVSVLAAQGYVLESTPPAGLRVLLRRDPPYITNGGTLTDLTDQIHPSIAAHAVAAAQMMQIPVAGLDVVVADISRPLEEQEGVIIEINANPGLWLHLAPWADSPRPIGDEIAAWLFPSGNNGRIPVVALAGDRDSGARRHLADLLVNGGFRVGSAGQLEMTAGDRSWATPPATPQQRAYLLFRNPIVDAALFETSADELLQHGFANDRCDVAILLAPAPLAGPEERDPAQFVRALTNALSPNGVFVASSDWPLSLLGVAPTRAILVANDENAEALRAHLRAGGQAVFVRADFVVLADGEQAEMFLGPAPRAVDAEEVQRILAAVAAAFSLGVGVEKTAMHLLSLS